MQDDGNAAAELEELKRQQEVKNLQLTEEKMRRELVDLRRPYLLRNPQLLTALITTIGALVGVSILISDNYFKAREQLNRLTEEKTARVAAEADRTQKEAAQKIAAAQSQMEEARRQAMAAARVIADSNKRRLEAEQSAKQQETIAARALSDAKRAQRQADIEQRKVFATLGLPVALIGHLDHVSSIEIRHPIADLIWLPTGLKELHAEVGEFLNLHDIPAGVKKLSLSGGADLTQIPDGIVSLTLDNDRGGMIDVAGARHLQHLEELSLISRTFLVRNIEQLSTLPKCRRVSLTTEHVRSFPVELADRVTELDLELSDLHGASDEDYVKNMRNLERLAVSDRKHLALAASLPRLRSLTYSQPIPISMTDEDLDLLPKSASLTDLNLHAASYEIRAPGRFSFPNFKRLEISAINDSFLKILPMFPGAELSVILDRDWDDAQFNSILISLRKFSNLKKLTLVDHYLHTIPSFSGFDSLEELSILQEPNMSIDASSLATLGHLKKLSLRNMVTGLDLAELTQLESLDLAVDNPPKFSHPLKSLKSLIVSAASKPAEACGEWEEFFSQATSGGNLRSLGLTARACQPRHIPPTVEHIEIRDLYDVSRLR